MLWLLLTSCGDTDDCTLSSSIAAFTPECSTAELARYDGESRLAVGGYGGVLVLYLPEELSNDTTYGGQSGNSMLAILDLTDLGQEETAFARNSTMTLANIGPNQAELHLSLDFDSGVISGPLVVPVTER